MSSPIALNAKNVVRKMLISFHQKASHNNRIEILSDIMAEMIDQIDTPNNQVRCLDVGCGDMLLAEKISTKTSKNLVWSCIDVHELPDNLKDDPKWKKYKAFNGKDIPFEEDEFDFAIIVDVLHHDMKNAESLITEASRTSKNILIKDHYEYSLYSRSMLKLMDFVGNWAYGVPIPKKYFSISDFKETISGAKLKIAQEKRDIKLYERSPFVQKILSEKWQFIALITR